MAFAVVVLASLVLAFLTADFRWRALALAGVFFLCIGLPSTVGDISAGDGAAPHVTTIIIISFAAIWPMVTYRAMLDRQNSAPPIPILCHILIALVAISAIATSASTSSFGFVTGFVLNQIVAPYIFCVLVYDTARHHESLSARAGRFFASVCLLEAALALAVKLQFVPQPFLASYDSTLVSWVVRGTRQLGTLDHPLTLGLLLAAGIPMAAYFRSGITASLAVFMMVVGISLTQSRIAAAGALVGLAYLLIVRSKSVRERFILLITAALGYTFLNIMGFLQGVLNRIQVGDEGSSQARLKAAQLFLDNWQEFKVSGIGMELSKDYFLSHGLQSSGESAAISYTVGMGVPLTVMYFGVIIWLIVRGVRKGHSLLPASAAAIVVLASIQLYNSVATESAAGMILWTCIGISLAAAHNTSRRQPEAGNSTPDKATRTVALNPLSVPSNSS